MLYLKSSITCRDFEETSGKLRELLRSVSQMNEASSIHHELEEEQVFKMIETAKLLLGKMRRRNEELEKVEESCENLSEQVREVKRQVDQLTGRLKSLIDSVKDVKPIVASGSVVEDVKPIIGNEARLPLPNILPTPNLLPLHKMPRLQ